ncbi:MAG TPA: hypothetical protein VHD33_03220 [Legionellaceae bacterium]|nr:hypothetical protein [Legionellaceae bacterium]
MKFLYLFLCWCISLNSHAQDMYPQGCEPWVVHDAVPNFSNEKPLIIMLHNLSDSDLWITHPVNNPGAQAGFSSLLQKGKWSALALNRKNESFLLKCIESKPGHEQQISCADVLAICQWPKSKIPGENTGIFWAAENMDFVPLKAYVERQGFVLD